MDHEKLEELREKKKLKKKQKQKKKELEKKKKKIINKLLTSKARSRLKNIQISNEQLGKQVEMLILQLSKSGSLQGKINDDQLKRLLKKIKNQKKDVNIKRR